MDAKQWGLMGFIMGQKLRDMRQPTEKEPIAYLYNGVQLPPLPEWDKETYPYCIITAIGAKYYFRAYTDPIVGGSATGRFADGSAEQIYCTLADGAWGSFASSTVTSVNTSQTVWTNHDMISSSDGTVYFAASDPIPVYE